MSFSLRAFILYFIILGTLAWFIIDYAIARINISMRQAAETVLVDTSHFMASLVESELNSATGTKPLDGNTSPISTQKFSEIWQATLNKKFSNQVFNLEKNNVDMNVYITDTKGIVLYDSTQRNVGKDFSQWRDVRLTLNGEYGARTSYIYDDKRAKGDPKIMVVATPIKQNGKIIGVLSVSEDIKNLQFFLFTESHGLKQYVLITVLLALAFGYLISHWLTLTLNKITTYAKSMAKGDKVIKPKFWDKRLSELTDSMELLRNELDGKNYVETYIHSLTHELKTPITSIHAAVEILQGPIDDADAQKFLNNINNSNQRMAVLVERMLSLAKLERLSSLSHQQEFDLEDKINTLLTEQKHSLEEKNIALQLNIDLPNTVQGDALLLNQAIANILDNAIEFCSEQGAITIQYHTEPQHHIVAIENTGKPIPDYALTRLYERFFSLPRPNSTKKSTGLGLSFVYEIMKLHNGSVQVENTPTGVRSTLKWPLQT